MRVVLLSGITALTLALSVQQVSALELSAAVGHTQESTSLLRLGLRKSFQSSWWHSDLGALSGYWAAGYTYWDGDKKTSNHSLSVSPVFVYEFNAARIKPYIEAGIGVAAFRHTRVEQRDLSTAFQFKDRIGVGLGYRNQRLGLSAIHYSNAGIKKPNDGINTYSLHYSLAL